MRSTLAAARLRLRGTGPGAVTGSQRGQGVCALDRGDAGMRGRRRRRRQGRPRARVWHGGSRARRAQRARHDLRGRLGVEAVHRGGGPAARARRQAVDRRSGAQVHPGAARLRRAADDPSHADAHQRPARLGRSGRHRRLAAHHARAHPRARARHRVAPEGAELHARNRLVLQQHRLQPGGDHRGAGERAAVRRVHARADLRAARHDPHLVARRLHADRQAPRDCLRLAGRTVTTRTCRSRTCTATAAC